MTSETILDGVAAAATVVITGGIAGAEHPSLRDETVPVRDAPGTQVPPILLFLHAHCLTGLISRRTRRPHGIRGNEDTYKRRCKYSRGATVGTVAEGEQVSHGEETAPMWQAPAGGDGYTLLPSSQSALLNPDLGGYLE